MNLSKIIEKTNTTDGVVNFCERDIKSIYENSKQVNEDSVFVLIKGANYDGADFLPEARARGCRVFLSAEKFKIFDKETLILSKNPRKTMAEIAKQIYFKSIKDMIIIGITGTKGKSTTAKILSECLLCGGMPTVMIGTSGVEYFGISKKRSLTDNTTPSSPLIYKTLAEAYRNGARAAVIEVSSQALAVWRVYKIPFTVCVFTNLSKDHIGPLEHSSYEEYGAAKLSLFKDYKAPLAVLNIDDPFARVIEENVKKHAEVITVGTEENSDYKYELISSSLLKTVFSLGGDVFEIPIGGEYNAKNTALALASASSVTGKDISFFKKAAENISIEGRYEVYEYGKAKIVIDFAHNKESFNKICGSIKPDGRLLLLFGSVGERSRARRSELASSAEQYADFSYITSDNPCNESPRAICDEIYSHFKDNRKACVIVDREEAIRAAFDDLRGGDVLLLLGKGHEKYQKTAEGKIPFSERDIILSLGARRCSKKIQCLP